jgi:hypothetical protein
MRAAFLVATAFLAAIHLLWLVCALTLSNTMSFLGFVPWVAVPVAAYVAAVRSPRRKFAVGIAITLPAAALFVLSNTAYQLAGRPVDFAGIQGALFVFGASLAVCSLLSAAGAGLAYLSPYRPV